MNPREIIVRLTGIDELQLRYLPSFFLGDFFLYLSDLGKIPSAPQWQNTRRRKAHRLRGLRINYELLLFEILLARDRCQYLIVQIHQPAGVGCCRRYLECELHLAPPRERGWL